MSPNPILPTKNDIKPYGCWNKPAHDIYLVQDGYFREPVLSGEVSEYKMTPRFIEIPNPMSRECNYDKRNSDWRCRGCEKP